MSRFVYGALDQASVLALETHLDACAECRLMVSSLAERSLPAPTADNPNETTAYVGRYTILRELGSGAAGEVFKAYDPELDRHVALKLLKDHTLISTERMRREARALARLNHPNVVPIYDVGQASDRTFIAMKLVAGGTLTNWLASEHRPWRSIVQVMLKAGHGVAAAHEAGLIHRDIKPSNILVSSAGDVRVTDFGLARTIDNLPPSSTRPEPNNKIQQLDEHGRLTVSGAFVGTPAYMAPEQTLGEPATAATDQFSFCVTLHEALYGETPFCGDGFRELANNVRQRTPHKPAAFSRSPKGLWRVIAKGLHKKPCDRYPSMRDLLADLDTVERAQPRRARRIACLGGVAIAVACATWFGLSAERSAANMCIDSAREVDNLWSDEAAQAIRTRFSQYDAAREFAQTRDALARFAAALTVGQRRACEAATNRSAPRARENLRLRCVYRHVDSFRATLKRLRTVDETHLRRVGSLLPAPSQIEHCDNAKALARLRPLPENDAILARLDASYAHLDEAAILRRFGRYKQAATLTDHALKQAEQYGYLPLLAEAQYLSARLEFHAGQSGKHQQIAQLHGIARLADEAGHDLLRARVLIDIAITTTSVAPQNAKRWIEYAQATIERSELNDSLTLKALDTARNLAAVQPRNSRDTTQLP